MSFSGSWAPHVLKVFLEKTQPENAVDRSMDRLLSWAQAWVVGELRVLPALHEVPSPMQILFPQALPDGCLPYTRIWHSHFRCEEAYKGVCVSVWGGGGDDKRLLSCIGSWDALLFSC